jgi:hypothetical protein
MSGMALDCALVCVLEAAEAIEIVTKEARAIR